MLRVLWFKIRHANKYSLVLWAHPHDRVDGPHVFQNVHPLDDGRTAGGAKETNHLRQRERERERRERKGAQ